jgi:sugar phosphate isomerase/epimerase
MKLGISIDVNNMQEFDTQISAAGKAGFKYCQIFYRGEDLNKNLAGEIVKICKEKNIIVGPLGCYLLALKPDESPMGFNLKKTHKLIDLMPAFGSDQLIIWSGTLSNEHMFQYDERNFKEEAFDKLTDIVKELLDHLNDVNGNLAVEPFFTHIINDDISFKKLKDKVKSDKLNIVMDTPNFFTKEKFEVQDKTINILFSGLENDISIIHFKDIKRAKDDSWPFEYPGPGKGELNYNLLMENINRYVPDCWGIIEHVQPPEYADAKKFLNDMISKSERSSYKNV